MFWKKKWLLLLLLTLPATAWGATEVYDGQPLRGSLTGQLQAGMVRADSTGRLFTMDANGNIYFIDAMADRTINYYEHATTQRTLQTPNGQTVANGGLPRAYPSADSCMPIITQGWKNVGVLFNYTLDDSVRCYYVALQIRNHPICNNDSISTFPWARTVRSGGATVDTVGVTAPAALTMAGYDTLAVSTEVVVVLDHTIGQAPGRKFFLLDELFGGLYAAPCTSIRIRYLNALGASSLPYGDSSNNVASGDTADPQLTITTDLIGWR